MDFDIIGTIEQIIANAERWYMAIYIYYITKAQEMHIKLIILACQNIFFRDTMADLGNLGVSKKTQQLHRVKLAN